MKNLQNLAHFIHSLSPKERKVIKRQVCSFDDDFKVDSLSIGLFRLIEKHGKECSADLVIKKLYGNSGRSSEDALRKLVDRVREKIYEATIMDINIDNHPFYVPLTIANLKVKKSIGIIFSALIRGLPLSERKRLLDSNIRLAYEFELFDELLILLKHKYEELDLVSGLDSTKERLLEINKVAEYSRFVMESKALVTEHIHYAQYKSIDPVVLSEEIRISMNHLYEIYSKTNIKNVYYNYLNLRAQYFHYLYDYESALKIFEEMLSLLKTEKSVMTMGKLTLCYTNMSYTQSYLYQFHAALDSMMEARKFYSSQRTEFVGFYQEAEVFLNIYMEKYEEAEALLRQIKSTLLDGFSIKISRTNYLMSIVAFLQGKYKESFFLLQETKEIEGDKEGWNIGIRLLHIFLTLETEKIDLADQRIGSLRKHIERTTKMKSVRKRDVIIFRILNQLSRSGFDFKEVWEDRQKDFRLLRSDDPDCRWIPRSHELILFDQWFEAKAAGRAYVPVFPVSRKPDEVA